MKSYEVSNSIISNAQEHLKDFFHKTDRNSNFTALSRFDYGLSKTDDYVLDRVLNNFRDSQPDMTNKEFSELNRVFSDMKNNPESGLLNFIKNNPAVALSTIVSAEVLDFTLNTKELYANRQFNEALPANTDSLFNTGATLVDNDLFKTDTMSGVWSDRMDAISNVFDNAKDIVGNAVDAVQSSSFGLDSVLSSAAGYIDSFRESLSVLDISEVANNLVTFNAADAINRVADLATSSPDIAVAAGVAVTSAAAVGLYKMAANAFSSGSAEIKSLEGTNEDKQEPNKISSPQPSAPSMR